MENFQEVKDKIIEQAEAADFYHGTLESLRGAENWDILYGLICFDIDLFVYQNISLPDGIYSKFFNHEIVKRAEYKEGNITNYREWSDDNSDILVLDTPYIDGKKHGVMTRYYPNGKLDMIMPYYKGKKHGLQVRFDAEGNVREAKSYVYGLPEGAAIIYYRPTQIANIEIYREGKRHGTYLVYYVNGGVHTEGQYRNDQREGTFTYYTENGKVQRLVEYKDNRIVSIEPKEIV